MPNEMGSLWREAINWSNFGEWFSFRKSWNQHANKAMTCV